LTRDTPAEATMRALFAEIFELPPDKVFVAEDMWIAYLSYFALGEGILVYSGTGSIGYYLSEDKDVIRVGGRGNLIDDGGSGFWIAREALKSVLRTEEENPGGGWTSTLGTCLAGALGGTDWNIVRSFVYGGDRGKIGSLARAVGEAAKADDATALRILREAGVELARLANALIKRLGPRPVALGAARRGFTPSCPMPSGRNWWPRSSSSPPISTRRSRRRGWRRRSTGGDGIRKA